MGVEALTGVVVAVAEEGDLKLVWDDQLTEKEFSGETSCSGVSELCST